MRCLEKDTRRRLRDIGDAGLLLAEPQESSRSTQRQKGASPARDRSRWTRWAAIAGWTAAVALAILNASWMSGAFSSVQRPLVVAQRLGLPLGSELVSGHYARSFDLSSDGTRRPVPMKQSRCSPTTCASLGAPSGTRRDG